jgi:hypothetical protein
MSGKKRKKVPTESDEEPKATETETRLVWFLRVLAWVLISTDQHLLDKDVLEAAIDSNILTYGFGILKGAYADAIEISILLQRFLNADNTVQVNFTEPVKKNKKSNVTMSLTKTGLLVTGATYFLVPVKTEKSNGTKPHYLYVRFDNSDLERFQTILNSGLPTDQNTVKSIDDLQLFLRDKCGLQSAVLHDVPGDGHCWYYMFLQLILCDATKRKATEQLLSLEVYLKCMLSRAFDLRHNMTDGCAWKEPEEEEDEEEDEKEEEDMSLPGLCYKIQSLGMFESLITGFFSQADTTLFEALMSTVIDHPGRADSDIVMMMWMKLNPQDQKKVSELVGLVPYRDLINGFDPLRSWMTNADNDTIGQMLKQVPESRQEYIPNDPHMVGEIVRDSFIELAGGSDSTHGGNTYWQCNHCKFENPNAQNACGICQQPVGKEPIGKK